jgi:hypothetical protein
MEMQSSERQAGTVPRVGISPRLGFSPTRPCAAAGTRPEPAVSVPRLNAAIPAATAVADPLDDPPGMRSARSALRGVP